MLNELHDLAECLKSSGVILNSWHKNFKPCPKGTATYFLLIDSQGHVTDLEPITDRDRISSIRKWEVAAGVSFPSFNVLPLFEVMSGNGKRRAAELRKAITSKDRPKPEDVKDNLDSLIKDSDSLWRGKVAHQYTKCMTTQASEIGNVLGTPPEEFGSILELIDRSSKLTSEKLHLQLTRLLVAKIVHSVASGTEWFDALFFHSGKQTKKWSLIAELADRSEFEFPANHEKVQNWMNTRFQSDNQSSQPAVGHSRVPPDIFAESSEGNDESFPSVRLPLGNVNLRAMSSESPCQRRYGAVDARSCRVGKQSRQEMKNALEWIGSPERRETTWSDVTSLNGVSGTLFAYPSQRVETAPELAGLLAGIADDEDPDGAKFEACASRVTASLTALAHEAPNIEVRVFVLTKPDGFRTKVISSGRYSVDRLLNRAEEWKEQSRNVPLILIRQFGVTKADKPFWTEPLIPYPAEVVSCLNTAWERAGTHAESVRGFGIGDGLALLLEEGLVLYAVATRAVRTFMGNSLSLALALGQAHHQGKAHWLGKKYGKQAVLLPSILGLLLAKLGHLKGDYMKGPPFLVGRLMSLADQLHVKYCHGVRKGQVPPQLVGNALMATALEQPTKALSLLAQRILPYKAWAQTVHVGEEVRLAKYLLGELGRVSSHLSEMDLPSTCTDAEKAEMLLGYLATAEKSRGNSPPTPTEGASE